jgi:SAM-dependent methyltransferase
MPLPLGVASKTANNAAMRIRDSGMPDEAYWELLFDVPLVLARLGIERFGDVAELGCGYGTFSIPVARAIGGTLYTFDIDPVMVGRTRERGVGLPIVAEVRDVMHEGFGVRVDAVLLFNILHCEEPVKLLAHAAEASEPGGEVLVIHWRCDIATPRGPAAAIRPRPEQIVGWAQATGRLEPAGDVIDLPPWHYGLRLRVQ